MTSLFLDDNIATALVLAEVLKSDVELALRNSSKHGEESRYIPSLKRANKVRRKIFELLGQEELGVYPDPNEIKEEY